MKVLVEVVEPEELGPDDEPLKVPVRAHSHDGAVDLRSRIAFTINPGERLLVPTGVKVAVPVGYGGFVIPRSGLALKHGITVLNAPGLVDAGYRGEVGVVLANHGTEAFHANRGTRIAQLAFIPVLLCDLEVVASLDETERGEGGFGSSGTH